MFGYLSLKCLATPLPKWWSLLMQLATECGHENKSPFNSVNFMSDVLFVCELTVMLYLHSCSYHITHKTPAIFLFISRQRKWWVEIKSLFRKLSLIKFKWNSAHPVSLYKTIISHVCHFWSPNVPYERYRNCLMFQNSIIQRPYYSNSSV